MIELIECGFGEQKAKIGSSKSVGVFGHIHSIRFAQHIRNLAKQNLPPQICRQKLPPKSTVSPTPSGPPLPPPGRNARVFAARDPVPAVYASMKTGALTDWSHQLQQRVQPIGRKGTATESTDAPWRVLRIPAGGRVRRFRRGREWRARLGEHVKTKKLIGVRFRLRIGREAWRDCT